MGKDYGSKIDYDPLWEGPLTQRRSLTNGGWLIFFACFMFLWSILTFSTLNDANIPTQPEPSPESQKLINIIQYSTPVIMKCVLFGTILSLVFLVLYRYFAKFMVYTAIFAFFVAGIVGIVFMFKQTAKTPPEQSTPMFLPILATIGWIILAIIFICWRRKINIACGVIKESGKAILDIPTVLVFPILPLFIAGLFLTSSLSVFGVLSNYTEEYQKAHSNFVAFCLVINSVALIWGLCFILGVTQMILAGTFGTWFWTHNKANVPALMVVRFTATTVRYHLGTVVFGSLIIAICKIVNMILNSIRDQLRREGGIAALLGICLADVIDFIREVIEYITTGAYVFCATHGTDFCESAKSAFNLIMRNAAKTVMVNSITDIVAGVTVFLVALLSAALSYNLVFTDPKMTEDTYPLVIAVVFVFAYAVSHLIFSVLTVAVQTLFLSALEDLERHDGSQDRPYYMNYKLRALFLKDAAPTSAV